MIRAKVTANRLPTMVRRLPQAMDRIVERAADRIADDMRRSIVDFPTPSQPGRPPHGKSGELEGSIGTQRLRLAAWRVYADALHALILEYGGRHLRPRPFARPAANREIPRLKREVQAAIRRL